jgi:hypothetical protein
VKLSPRNVSFVVFVASATGLVALASSSCSTNGGGGFSGDAGQIVITESDGNTIVATKESDGNLVVMTESGTMSFTVTDGDTVSYPDTSTTTGSDATTTTMTGADGQTSTGSDATTITPVDGACPDSGAAVTCTPTSTGGIKLTSNYLPASDGIGMGGYAYFYDDMMSPNTGTSTSCIESTQLCAKGTVDLNNYPTTGTPPAGFEDHYGAGIGFNLNQAQSTGCASMPILPYTITSSELGITYALTNLPNSGTGQGGVRLIIGNSVTTNGVTTGTDYCVPLSAASGTIPWSEFNSECWSDAGTYLTQATAESLGPIHINIGLVSSTAAATFDFCVDSMSFATSLTTSDAGKAASCGTSACCEYAGIEANGSGSYTCYTFAQGTVNDKTYCGYSGSESAYTGGGSGACETGTLAYSDTVPNVGPPSKYFAAFPSTSAFGQGAYCGLCLNVSYAGSGKTLMATVVDECPTTGGNNPPCAATGHLDLSAALARDLGFGISNGGTTVVGDPSNTTWEAVACPITSNNGNIVVVWNGSSNQVYFQNVVWPVAAVSGASQSNGVWNLGSGSGSVTLTDLIGHKITGTLPATSGGSLGVQFPATCTN